MTDLLPWFAIVHGVLWLVGYVLICIDYEQKIDEGRAITARLRQ